jgi:hypothetical protein
MYLSTLNDFSNQLWPTVTGLEFHTAEDGNVKWTLFEDAVEIVRRIPITDIPQHIPRIEISELTYVDDLVGSVSAMLYEGKQYAMKAHNYASQNVGFPLEVDVLIKLGNAPHVAQMAGVVVELSLVDGNRYVQGVLLQYCGKGDLRALLEDAVELSRKDRWAAQIAHGLIEIHKTGLMQGI